MCLGSALGYKRIDKSPLANELSEEQRKEVAAALIKSNQLSSDLSIYFHTLLHRTTTLYSLTCQSWEDEHPEADLMNELASSLSRILERDHLELRALEFEMGQVKFARRKWDEDKLDIILARYRDDEIKKLVAEIISLKDPMEWKQWQEACIDKGLDLEAWKRVRKAFVPDKFGHPLTGDSYDEVLLREFVGRKKAIDMFCQLFKRAS
jgi:hypothetical protein